MWEERLMTYRYRGLLRLDFSNSLSSSLVVDIHMSAGFQATFSLRSLFVKLLHDTSHGLSNRDRPLNLLRS